MDEWQPIETAPKDGRVVVLGSPEHVWFGRWHAERGETLIAADKPYWEPFDLSAWYLEEGSDVGWFEPTHWMPLPPPPSSVV